MFERMTQVPSRKDLMKPRYEGTVNIGCQKTSSDLDLVKLRFCSTDDGVVKAEYRGIDVYPSRYSSIKSGEVWDCHIDVIGFTGRYEATGIRCLQGIPEDTVPEDMESETEVLHESNEQQRIEQLEKSNELLASRLSVMSEMNRQLCDEVRSIPGLRLTIEQLETELDAEQTMVEAMGCSGGYADICALKKRIGEMQDMLDSKGLEIELLKEKLRKAGLNEEAKVVPKVQGQIVSCLTGPSRIYCRLLEDGRYSVRFNPLEKKLFFIPNDIGTVECRGQEVYIPGLAAYSDFQFVRDLTASADGDGVVIEL